MSFLKKMVEETRKVFGSEQWVLLFQENYGKPEEAAIKAADEAFFHLLGDSRHEVVAEAVCSNPSAFCRPARIKAFLTGQSSEKVDDNIVNHTYPPAPAKFAEAVGEAVGTVLMDRIEKLGRSHQGVGRDFWAFTPDKTGYNEATANTAATLSQAMHGLLNIAEGIGDAEGFKSLAGLFYKMFGNLPGGVYHRVRPVLWPDQVATGGQPQQVQPDAVDGNGKVRDRQTTTAGGEGKPRSPRPASNTKGRGAKAGAGVQVNSLKPTLEDRQALDEYNKSENGRPPVNDAMAGIKNAVAGAEGTVN